MCVWGGGGVTPCRSVFGIKRKVAIISYYFLFVENVELQRRLTILRGVFVRSVANVSNIFSFVERLP